MNTVGATTSLPGLEPEVDRARELAERANIIPVRYRFIDDLETPVSAFLKLRGDGPAFLLESAEHGRLGRWSFLGFMPRSVLRWSDGSLSEWAGDLAAESGAGAAPDRVTEAVDPYAAAAEYLGRYEIAEPSLEAVFIELVGRPPEDEGTLAADAPTTSTDPDADPRPVVEGAV